MTTRIVLADDHQLVRAGVRVLIESMPAMEVVGETGDGREALKLVKQLQPDIVLMDIGMQGLNGLDACAKITNAHPQTRVIILSMHANEEYVLQALRVGASGYLLKDAATQELEMAITAVRKGETYLTPMVSKHVINEYLKRNNGVQSSLDLLSIRQREVLQLIAEGATTREIADTLNLSVKTIETHRAQLMERLDIHDIPGLVRFAIRHGLVAVDG